MRYLWVLLCLLLLNTDILASPATIEDEDIAGFTIDQTITRVGHEFTRHLAHYRHSNPQDAKVNLTVYERPSARWGNLIWVTHQNRQVYRRFLQPRNNQLKSVAEEAAQQIFQIIEQQRLQALFADTFDMDQDEF
jgi:curli production assembly/transport component CsgE